MLERPFREVWDQLRAKRPQLTSFLEEVRVQKLRGIRDLAVNLSYPVSVLAGPNGCGKTTLLLAAACAYKVPTRGPRDFVPSTLFPNFRVTGTNHGTELRDGDAATALEYHYIDRGRRNRMVWSRGRNWNRSFLGQKGAEQPTREVYLRTLANLTSPSEAVVRFADSKGRDLLLAEREGADAASHLYSEFHMSAGERAILRLSRDLSSLRGALVLIDEVEAGLHPVIQQQLLLELQRLALRNDLQILVTTHSPVVLECVPTEARIFLERTAENVVRQPAYRDVVQNALYGSSLNKLSILCEDETAASLVLGAIDVLNPKLDLRPSDYMVGRDTGKDSFPDHVRAFAKFKQLDEFLFVLDGGTESVQHHMRQAASEFGQPVRILALPEPETPESWIWERLKERPGSYSHLGLEESRLEALLEHIETIYAGASDKPKNIAKNRLGTLLEQLRVTDWGAFCREVGRIEAAPGGGLENFAASLELEILSWRQQST